ncbi:hypothetical protein AGMMS50276_25370 [Synergistales bacterium]|nr:hypothetical protein AGMMS50276_25370 [Synergistales bacterium]
MSIAIIGLGTMGKGMALNMLKSGKPLIVNDIDSSRMESRANDGTLTVMCGGEQAVFDRIKPILELIGNKILFMGGVGSGQLTKLINQLLFDINAAAAAEILPMALPERSQRR